MKERKIERKIERKKERLKERKKERNENKNKPHYHDITTYHNIHQMTTIKSKILYWDFVPGARVFHLTASAGTVGST